MKPQYTPRNAGPRTMLTLLLLGSIGFSASTPLFAQAVDQTTERVADPSKPAQQEEAIELSPFVVTERDKTGYLTSNTLLGSRIKTPLIDTPSSITVLTPEYLQDLGAKNLYDALDYTTGANIDETSIRFLNSWHTAAVRVRGMRATTAFTQDFYKLFWVPDTYNTSDFGLARGANSILFGVGSPAGVFTATSKSALFYDQHEVGIKIDTWGSKRGEADFNKVIIPKRLALRVALLDEDRRFFTQPAWNKTKAAYAALAARVVDRQNFKTTLSGNFEYREADRNFGQQWTPGDSFTPWAKSGRPTFPGARPGLGLTNAQLAPLGIELSSQGDGGAAGATQVITSSSGISFRYQQDQLATQRAIAGSNPAHLRGDVTFRRQADSPVNFDVNMSGPGPVNPFHGNRYTVMIDQQIGGNFFAQLAYSKHDYKLMWGDPGVGIWIFADVNENLPDGSPNPDVGKFFTMSPQRPEFFRRNYDELRFMGTYSLNLARRLKNKWWGEHQISAMALSSHEYQWHDVFTEQNTTPLPGASPDISHPSNRVFRRTYLDSNSQHLAGPSMVEGINAGGVKSVLLARAAPDSNKSTVQSLVETIQSRFWDGRIVLTWGLRQDDLKRNNGVSAGLVRHPDTRDFPRAETLPFAATPVVAQKLDSTSRGAVFHVTKWAALTWNESENFNPQATFLDLFGRSLAPQGGKAKDYGVRFRLPDGKLYVSVNVFESSAVNNPAHGFFRDVDMPYLRGLLLLSEGSAGAVTTLSNFADTEDEVASGHEVEVVANPTRNWRLSFSYGKIDIRTSNVLPILGPWWQAKQPQFLALSREAQLPASVGVSGTVAAAYDFWNEINIGQKIAGEGRSPNAHRRDNASFVTNYTFTSGPLKHFSAGFKTRYYGKSKYVNGAVDRAYIIAGVNVGYRTTLFKRAGESRGVDWSTFVHVDNVTNFQGVIRSEGVGVWRQLPGASAALTSTFRF